jgi:gentisate 1,2-dioxygenase
MVTNPLTRVDARRPARDIFANVQQPGTGRREIIMAVASRANSDYGQFMDQVKDMSLFPLWERVGGLKPGTKCVPAHWSYDEVRPHLMRACDLVTKKEASRRVLCLENPALRGTTFVCDSLFAGLQIIMPGEVAPSHRHTPSALRFIVEGEGAYTAVAGEKLPMKPGDFVVTPAWAWHDHGNLGKTPVVWLDGLDTPFARFFGAAFYEPYPQDTQPLDRPEGESTAVYGMNLIPDEFVSDGHSTPVLIYPYERTRAALDSLARTGKPHPAHGFKLRYANPANGKHPFPTMAVSMQRLPAGFAGKTYRSTGSAVFAVHTGGGIAKLGDEDPFPLKPHDVFVVPPWVPYSFRADSELELFSYSDRAGQEALGYWREQMD